jgi:hypothetical protein
MGETVRGGYYKGINGKFHDANGQPVEAKSEPTLKKAREAEVEVEGAPSATDPGPLAPLVPVVGEPAPEAGRATATKTAKAKRGRATKAK